MSAHRMSPSRRLWLEARLTERDLVVLDWLSRLRLADGRQLEALCFGGLKTRSRPVVRGRVLGRLTRWALLEVVDRRVGGAASGSASPVYRLAAAGHVIAAPDHSRATKPYTNRFTSHTLATSQVAADLVTATHDSAASLPTFVTEPASWMPDAFGSYLKPDAYLQLQAASVTMHWWLEIDLGTESLPALERKLRNYLEFVNRGQLGPHGLVPQVLISLTSGERQHAVEQMINRLPEPAPQLFVPCHTGRVVAIMLAALWE